MNVLAIDIGGTHVKMLDSAEKEARKVGDWVVTPRIGKPVEVQAPWLNALAFAIQFDPRWQNLLELGLRNFRERFWNAPHTPRGCPFQAWSVAEALRLDRVVL